MIRRSLPLVLALAALPAPPQAQASPAEAARTDTSDVYESRRNHLLAFPLYVWNAVVYPIGRFTIWVEHEQVPARVVDLFTNEAETFGVFPYGALGGETGTAGGFTTFHTDLFGRGKEFSASMVANRDNYKGAALYDDPGIGGGPWYWKASVEALTTRHENATINGELRGRGPLLELEQRDARIILGLRSNYGETEGYEPDAVIELRLSHGFRELVADGPLPLEVPGLNEALNQLSVGAMAAFDDRDFKRPTASISHPLNYQFPGRVLLFADDRYYSFRDTAFPERGGLVQIEADYTAGSGDVRYLRYAAEVHRFFTLFYRDRILGIRARLENAHALDEGSIVPYSDMPVLGGGQRLRGYRRGSFRDKGSLLLGAEYRYPIWDTWNACLFWDEGQVFERYGDLEAGSSEYSFGAGISVRTESSFLFSLHIARSEEEKALTGFSMEKEF